jgi:hypothetical protein
MLWQRLRQQRGQGLVEFAVIFPLLFFFLFAIFDVGLGLNRQATLQHAVREGARYGALSDNADGGTFVRDRTSDQAQGLVPPTGPGGGENWVALCYEDMDGSGGDPGPGDAVNVTAHYVFHPTILDTALSLFGSNLGDIPIDVTGSARLERALATGSSWDTCAP